MYVYRPLPLSYSELQYKELIVLMREFCFKGEAALLDKSNIPTIKYKIENMYDFYTLLFLI